MKIAIPMVEIQHSVKSVRSLKFLVSSLAMKQKHIKCFIVSICGLAFYIYLLCFLYQFSKIMRNSNVTVEDMFLAKTAEHFDTQETYLSEEFFFNDTIETPFDIEEIRNWMMTYNEHQLVLNEDKYGPLANDSVIVLIQVHQRYEYLKYMIYSLSLAGNISQALLIFSHDYYDDRINRLVDTIDFCRVMQIFYPYSVQTHPNEFPGDDPIECLQQSSTEGNCHNASYTQMKHHWWWKANMVFDGLEITKNHKGLVLFLEEDHVVSEDFLHVLLLMQQNRGELCPQCNVLSLGNYLTSFHYFTYHKKVEAVPWFVGRHNMGFAINRTTWRNIKRCANYFCKFNDYNWDWSLQHVSNRCLRKPLLALALKGTRVFHIGNCGFHHAEEDCTSASVIAKVKLILDLAQKSHQLYPTFLRMVRPLMLKTKEVGKYAGINGFWGDPRDHQLCLNMTLPNR